jgi:hypothetical protein
MKYYNVILNTRKEGKDHYLKYKKVNRVERLVEYVEDQGHKVRFVNYYCWKTKEFLFSEKL